jgi:hypothetical protein
MLRRLLRTASVAVGIVLCSAAPAHATPAPEPVPVDDAPTSLIPVPVGCAVPEPADVAFVGTVLDKDAFIEKGTVRFQIDQVRSGDAGPFSVDGLIDVRYGPDSKYLDIGTEYLVGASVDPSIGVLASKVSPETPLFGGDAVVGLEDTEVECPTLDDPVQTLNLDGTPVDSGLLSPLFEDRRLLLAVIGVPAAVTGAVLVALVLLRRLLEIGFKGVFALGRQAVTPKPDHRAARIRAHRDADESADDESASDDDLVSATSAT